MDPAIAVANFGATLLLIQTLGEVPNYVGNWKKLLERSKNQEALSEQDSCGILEARLEWLFHKMMLYDLLLAFSKEHKMNPQLVAVCREQRPLVLEEAQAIQKELNEINKALENVE
jgi:hypothetical protein